MTRRMASACVRTSNPATVARPGVGAEQGRQDPDGRGLARAVGAEQAEDRALLDHEVDAVERADLALAAAVDLHQALGDDRLRALRRGDDGRGGGWSRDGDSGTSDRVPVTGASGASIGAGRRERESCQAFVASVKPRPASPRRGRSRRRSPRRSSERRPSGVDRGARAARAAAPPPGRRAARASVSRARTGRRGRSAGRPPGGERRRGTRRGRSRGSSDRMDAKSNTGRLQGLAWIPEDPESASVVEVVAQPAPWSELQVKTLFLDRRPFADPGPTP